MGEGDGRKVWWALHELDVEVRGGRVSLRYIKLVSWNCEYCTL